MPIAPRRAAVLLLALAACGPEAEPEPVAARPPLERLDFALAADAGPAPTEAIHQHFEPADEAALWVSDGPPPVAGRDLLTLTNPDRAYDEIRLTRAGRYDPSAFNRLRVRLTYTGTGHPHFGVTLLRDGEPLAPIARIELTRSLDLRDYDVDVPTAAMEGEADALELYLGDVRRKIEIRTVTLVQVPPGELLPDASGAPALVDIDADMRRGEAVTTGRAIETELPFDADLRLSFSYGQPRAVRRSGTWSRLRLVMTDGAGAEDARDLGRTGTGEWRHVTVRPQLPGPGPLRVRFEVEAEDDGPAAWVVAEAQAWRPEGAPPSILLVTTDTHRGDHLGAADRGVDVATPALDALAARGVFFEDAFAPINITSPSHIALMTGSHPRDFGIVHFTDPLSDDATTLAEVLADAGYATWAVISAGHLGPRYSGLGQGFDRFGTDGGPARPAGGTVDLAERWLEDLRGRAVFLWVHVYDAHDPYAPPAPFDRRYWDPARDPRDPSLPDPGVPAEALPPTLRDVRDLAFAEAQYKGEITYLDQQLGRLFADRRFRRGVIAVVGDHGESLGEHRIWFNHDGLYPQTLHVPLIIAWGGGPPGVRVPRPVTHLDVARSLLDLVGLEDAPFAGRPLVSPGGVVRRRPEPRFALASLARAVSVQVGDDYLILHLKEDADALRPVAHHQVELFDLAADPGCERDLVGERPDVAARLRALAIEWLEAAPPPVWKGDIVLDDAMLEQLRALGYAEVVDGRLTFWKRDDCAWCRRFP